MTDLLFNVLASHPRVYSCMIPSIPVIYSGSVLTMARIKTKKLIIFMSCLAEAVRMLCRLDIISYTHSALQI